MSSPNDTPLIHTIYGNLPIADLDYQTEWEDVPGAYTKLVETYRLNGEVVRQSAHVLSRTGLGVGAQAASLN